ncbi:cyclase family protein [Ferrimonas pelagia]|uniref:Cyclase family protein n=2 Tax=Ferrimonas pelagia TaxID=1177826 RepID=A0ABP9ETN9_9GAMM
MWQGQWIDLTHEFSTRAIYWPTAKAFEHTEVFKGVTDKGFFYASYDFAASEHGGTHLDAPIHFSEGQLGAGDIPLQQLIGPGVRIEVMIGAQRNHQISVEEITRWEQEHGQIPDSSIVLFDTGSAALWPDKERYMGTAERGEAAVAKLAFPGIHPDAALFLIQQRNVKAVGIDTPSLDYGGSVYFHTHQILFQQNIPGFENVADLSALPPTGFGVIALPMKIKHGSGAPLRIIALIPPTD